MHSFMFRANAVLTFGVTVLALLCCLASVSDNLHHAEPSVDLQILRVESFQRLPNGNDEVKLVLNITADLQSLFTWNTKQLFVFVAAEYATPKNVLNQISLWDTIVERKENATIAQLTRNKYSFVDQGSNLRGLDFNLTMYWNVMPLTGAMYTGKTIVPGLRLPQQYRFIRGHVGVCNCYEGNFLRVAQCICCLIASCSSVCHFVFEAQKQYDE